MSNFFSLIVQGLEIALVLFLIHANIYLVVYMFCSAIYNARKKFYTDMASVASPLFDQDNSED